MLEIMVSSFNTEDSITYMQIKVSIVTVNLSVQPLNLISATTLVASSLFFYFCFDEYTYKHTIFSFA